MPRQRADRVELLDDPLERHVLVRVRGKAHVPGPGHEIAEARVAGGVDPQHERVDEEADQVLQRIVGATRHRGTQHDVLAGPQLRQGRSQRRL